MDSTASSFTLWFVPFTPNDKIFQEDVLQVPIPLKNGHEFYVCDLKPFIFSKMPLSSGTTYEPNNLILWKPNFNLPIGDPLTIQKTLDEIEIDYEKFEESRGRATMLPSSAKVNLKLMNQIEEPQLHILVQKPLRNHPPVLAINPGGSQVMRRSLSGDWYYRPQTVNNLYWRLQDQRFLLVSGTPGSGKSILAELLTAHIHEKEPKTQVIFLTTWPEDPKRQLDHYREEVEKKGWHIHNPNCVLVIDEAQRSYSDRQLWVGQFKKIASETVPMKGRVVLFASYGSASTRLLDFPTTPLLVPKNRRVGLWPVNHNDGLPPVGLLISRDEYPFIADKSVRKHHFDTTFLEWVFNITAGHAGAVVNILKFASVQSRYRQCRFEEKFTLRHFVETVSMEEFWTCLKSSMAFSRGMPSKEDLQRIEIRSILEPLCVVGTIEKGQLSEDGIKCIEECHSNGWLYNYKGTNDEQWYSFSTPLHQWFVARHIWQLEPTIPPEATLLEFIKRVIRGFSYSKLFTMRDVNGSYVQDIPEAHYQQEFYRSCGVSSTLIFPEFGCSSGRVDFYVPSKEWGIELLREGRQIKEHCDRFFNDYYKDSVPVKDYIVLDCRTSFPEAARADRHLYHMIFANRSVFLLDHNLTLVDKFALLG